MIILKCRSSGGEPYPYADLNLDVAYMLNRKDPESEWFEIVILSCFDAAWSTLCAEACLWLAKITGCNVHIHIQEASESELIKEGLKCLEVSIKTLTNEDGTIRS
mmetsp:Transcript_5466/g.8418  ORF Transcript_5466/g.8418 Transcript_5466/m.8418 type:complete len:105 (+) Transcript_5466:237-551(+)